MCYSPRFGAARLYANEIVFSYFFSLFCLPFSTVSSSLYFNAVLCIFHSIVLLRDSFISSTGYLHLRNGSRESNTLRRRIPTSARLAMIWDFASTVCDFSTISFAHNPSGQTEKHLESHGSTSIYGYRLIAHSICK